MSISELPPGQARAWLREFLAAVSAFEGARPEHKAAAATSLKQAIIAAHSYGLMSEKMAIGLIAAYELAGD